MYGNIVQCGVNACMLIYNHKINIVARHGYEIHGQMYPNNKVLLANDNACTLKVILHGLYTLCTLTHPSSWQFACYSKNFGY